MQVCSILLSTKLSMSIIYLLLRYKPFSRIFLLDIFRSGTIYLVRKLYLNLYIHCKMVTHYSYNPNIPTQKLKIRYLLFYLRFELYIIGFLNTVLYIEMNYMQLKIKKESENCLKYTMLHFGVIDTDCTELRGSECRFFFKNEGGVILIFS